VFARDALGCSIVCYMSLWIPHISVTNLVLWMSHMYVSRISCCQYKHVTHSITIYTEFARDALGCSVVCYIFLRILRISVTNLMLWMWCTYVSYILCYEYKCVTHSISFYTEFARDARGCIVVRYMAFMNNTHICRTSHVMNVMHICVVHIMLWIRICHAQYHTVFARHAVGFMIVCYMACMKTTHFCHTYHVMRMRDSKYERATLYIKERLYI